MQKPRINMNVVRKQSLYTVNRLTPLIRNNANRRLNSLKNELLQEFDNHPVTKEVESPNAASQGILPDGNLYSFIGFNEGEQPAVELREVIEDNITLGGVRTSVRGNVITASFGVNLPSKEKIQTATPMPEWASGSWAELVEKGISGLERYIFGVFLASRSGRGLQLKGDVRAVSFDGVGYLTELLNNFRKRFE